MTKIYMMAALIVMLAGCANKEVLMVNDKGQQRYCYEVHNWQLRQRDRGPRIQQMPE